MTTAESVAHKIAHLQSLIDQVKSFKMVLKEDVGSGWVDITEKSTTRWSSKIKRLKKRLNENYYD